MAKNVKIVDGQFHVRSGKQWYKSTNFTFDLMYEVYLPANHVYVVMVTREDGKQGTAHFTARDCHSTKEFEHALNSSFHWGGLMCLLAKRESCDLVSELAKVKRQTEQADHNGYVFSRNHITNAGLQPGTTLCFLSPKCIIDVSTGNMVDPDTCSYVWLPNINISGLPKKELCRCTLAFVNSWLTKSTLPFIWDDPTTAEDVSQVAVDVSNGCVRGKSTDQYFSRVLVIKVEPPTKEKRPGDAKVLEDHSKLASAAFPIVLNALSTITVEQVHQENNHQPSRPGDLFDEVTDYLESVLIPYYQRNISKLAATSAVTSQCKQLTVQLDVVNGATCTLVKSADLAMRKEAMAEFLVVSNVVDRVKELGGKVNKTVRINGKPTKCLTLPKSVFTKEKWQEIVNKIFDIQDEDVVDPEEPEEVAEVHLPQLDRVMNVQPVFTSLPPILPTTTTPICTPPSSPCLPSPPQFEVDYPAPPSLPPTPPQLSLEEEVLDDSFVLPPPPPSPTVCSDEDLDATIPIPPPEVMCTEVLSKPIPVQQIANLMSATPASPGVSIT
ncbi:unnamed protein product [Mytilus edulis]|uniref:Uncharacterized protein n=1 Tax=Mytilus edulis TaxID=6550 RepID=A0A8S3RE89_MYTED|nr:unnamed protein product [Mytilus edulis]